MRLNSASGCIYALAGHDAAMLWQLAQGRTLDLTVHGLIMGVVNVTPDSFSDGGEFLDPLIAAEHAAVLLAEGAAIIDVGGESTRPGASPVTETEEFLRVIPVVEAILARRPGTLISVDTSKAAVADAALASGATIVNDVSGLRGDSAMAEVIARHRAGVVLMHMQGEPRTMQHEPQYENVVIEVRAFFEERLETALAAGISAEQVAFDPGVGFGKTVAHNLAVIRDLAALAVAGRPLVLGVSRKSFLARVAGAESLPERLAPTIALTALGRERGARILRVHDVRPNLFALRTVEALLEGYEPRYPSA